MVLVDAAIYAIHRLILNLSKDEASTGRAAAQSFDKLRMSRL